MNFHKFKSALNSQSGRNDQFRALHAAAKAAIVAGATPNMVLSDLKDLLNCVDEDTGDIVLEVMDCFTDWSPDELRIGT